MSDKTLKDLRKQVRNVVKELLPEVLNTEQYAQLKNHVDARLNEVDAYIKGTLSQMAMKHDEVLRMLLDAYVQKKPVAEEIPTQEAVETKSE